MSKTRLATWIAAPVAILALMVAGCGGSSSSAGTQPASATSKPMTSASASATSKPTTSASSSSTAGIPQQNGGDHDPDNNGGPSDGDGNL